MDERRGKPSASSMERVYHCAGSFQMERHLTEVGSRKAADKGHKLHEALAGLIPFEMLNHSEKICFERIAFEEGRLVEQFGMEGCQPIKEQRLWFKLGGVEMFSGQPDVAYVGPKSILVINYKTGYYPPTPIAENIQMETEAALAFHNLGGIGTEVVHVALIHPNVPDGPPSQSYSHSADDLTFESIPRLASAASNALKKDAPRIPGSWCEWCLGKKLGCCGELANSKIRFQNSYAKRR